jgi:hypothetical protein
MGVSFGIKWEGESGDLTIFKYGISHDNEVFKVVFHDFHENWDGRQEEFAIDLMEVFEVDRQYADSLASWAFASAKVEGK